MYLKSLEIRGFKSFADKTELAFKSGITGVVGPNGSGKSNIADAVRWVLGEQSVKQLRGGRMEDVIFSGTQYRKSLGQAQVSMTLDNSCGTLPIPYNEVTVTRKLFRSGDSEYLINNSQVRLKDVNELFMDTGIGKEGYSIIGQGKIDAILSGKPEERRSLVEEAAGITKFKSRKEEGEKKLKNAEDNLDRVEDIISTYEERIEPLRVDKEKAEKFLEYSGELVGLQVSVIVSDLNEMDKKNEGLLNQREVQNKRFEDAKKDKESDETELSKLEDKLNEISSDRSQTREDYYLRKGILDEVINDIRFGEARISNDSEKLKANSISYITATEKLENNKIQIITATEGLNNYENKLAKSLDDVTSLRDSAMKLEEDIRDSQEVTLNLKNREEALGKDLKDLSSELAKEIGRREYLEGQKKNLGSVSDNYIASLRLNEDGLSRINSEVGSIVEKNKDINTLISKFNEEAKVLKSSRETEESNLEKIKKEIRDGLMKANMLKSLEDSFEGYNRSVKDLMGYLKKTGSAHLKETSVVGEVIETEPRFSLAIEAALGAFIGNIITATDTQAKELISVLKSQNLGRCTFLPRNVIKANRIALPNFKTTRVLGFASDLVKTDLKYKEIIDSILARTIVVETMDDAVSAARETSYRIKIVTLDGDIIASGGAMTGGSLKTQRGGIISRKADISILETQIEEYKSKIKSFEDKITGIRTELDVIYNKINTETDKLRSGELELARAIEREEGFKREISKIKGLIEDQGKESISVESALGSSLKAISGLEEKISSMEKEIQEIEVKLDEVKKLRTEKFREFDDLKDKITEARVIAGKNESELEQAKETINGLKSIGINISDEIENLIKEKTTLELVTSELTNEVENLKSRKKLLEEEMKELDKNTIDLEAEETKVKSEIKEKSNKLSVLRDEYYSAEKDLYKTNLQLEKYESDRNDLIQKLNEDLNITLAEATDKAFVLESKPKARKRISEIKGMISALGTVNLSAIEEFAKVSESYSFLTKQRDDLLKAKEELTELINDMTGKMKSLFKENFIVLSKNFTETFKQLFSGGHAELSLGAGDELTGNIDIIVQPPGKKLQNLNLLSGGEKVLSAIALTFAILKMKPSPFCLLDEIEAALDDSNVYRYANFLKDFAKDTQFILITHRKGTMEAANMLYGVTMEEKGISKIVSVDLDTIKG